MAFRDLRNARAWRRARRRASRARQVDKARARAKEWAEERQEALERAGGRAEEALARAARGVVWGPAPWVANPPRRALARALRRAPARLLRALGALVRALLRPPLAAGAWVATRLALAALRAAPAPAAVAVGWALLPPLQPPLGAATWPLWAPLLVWVWVVAPPLSGALRARREEGAPGPEVGAAYAFHAAWALGLTAWAAAGGPAPLLGLYLVNHLLWQPYRRFAGRHGRPLGFRGRPRRAPPDGGPP